MKNAENILQETAQLPMGFKAAGIHAGIKESPVKDLAVIVSEIPAAVAGTFTTNQVQAAPVKLNRKRLEKGVARAVVINSGNANACTGEQGMRDAVRMGDLAAGQVEVAADQVFVCSTGGIGALLPMDALETGIPRVVAGLDANGGPDFAEAILTTDTCPKHVSVEMIIDDKPVTITGFAKGAGMVEPNMATMLCFLVTDADIARPALQDCLLRAVDQSFNRITVDGDRSTNDTVLFLANGQAGNNPLLERHPDWDRFNEAVGEITLDLALKIVRDGEGAEKLITVRVQGAPSDKEADEAARSVANSLLVKTSWAGPGAIWGRIMDAVGYSRARIVEEQVDIYYDQCCAVKNGVAGDASPDELGRVVAADAYTIDIHLNLGPGEAVVYTCECSEEYVRINM